jgi:hypothetical protein
MSRLPDFIIIGAQKCGTSAAMRLLRRHPQIGGIRPHKHPAWEIEDPPVHREPHFFDTNWSRGIDWYKRLFKKGAVIGEKTPSYMADSVAMHRLASVVPEAKIVVFLRNPVDRMYSQFCMIKRRNKKVSLSFEEWIQTPASADAFWRGMYWKQLQTVYALFHRSQVHVSFMEDLKRDPVGVMSELQRFLCVAPVPLQEQPRESQRSPMHADARQTLEEWYQPHVQKLYEILPTPQVQGWCLSQTYERAA